MVLGLLLYEQGRKLLVGGTGVLVLALLNEWPRGVALNCET